MSRRQPQVQPNGLRIEMSAEVQRRIRRHARSSMSAEICGVLIGSARHGLTVVDASIEGEAAREAGSHVTFTQDTWTHIYQIKDTQYPDARIVGWYHSHPGFGIFLSEHDVFIHSNFFSDPSQIAWVFDPHSDEEGCFAWERGEIVRVREVALQGRDGTPVIGQEPGIPPQSPMDEKDLPMAPGKRSRGVARWSVLVITHLCALILGAAAGAIFLSRVIVLPIGPGDRPALTQPSGEKGPSK